VKRVAYRAPGVGNLHPADAALNLPVERHSHGLGKLAALDAARGSFHDAVDAIQRRPGSGSANARSRSSRRSRRSTSRTSIRPGARCRASAASCWCSPPMARGLSCVLTRCAPAPRPGRAPRPSPCWRARISRTASGWPRSAPSTTRPRRHARRPTSSCPLRRRATSPHPGLSQPTSGLPPAWSPPRQP
jgi:hypothetical protein